MSADARRRRTAAKANPYTRAILAPRRPPEGCMDRCPECLTRCISDHQDLDHFYACDH